MAEHALRALVAAVILVAPACATQQQTGKAMQVTGTAAVVSGAMIASSGDCDRVMPDERNGSVYVSPACHANGNRQALGAAVAAAGMGVAALGSAIEQDANRLDAARRIRSSSSASSPPGQIRVPARASLLALPDAPFAPKKGVAPEGEESGTSEPDASASSATGAGAGSSEPGACPPIPPANVEPTAPGEHQPAPAE